MSLITIYISNVQKNQIKELHKIQKRHVKLNDNVKKSSTTEERLGKN